MKSKIFLALLTFVPALRYFVSLKRRFLHYLILTFLLSPFTFLLVEGQVPQGINYQAIARGSDNKELANTALQVRLSVLSDTNGFKANGTGVYVWEEQHNINTNSIGLFNLVLGSPLATRIQGSALTFSAIGWKTQPLYLGVKVYYLGVWKNMGSSQLTSVPFSMVSGDLAGPLNKLSVAGTTSVMDEPLFEVKNKNGQTVFAVFNEGVRIYVEDGVAKGTKGGFAIGGFGTAKANSQPLLVVDPDSIRAYIGTNAKGVKGGFAIGGFTTNKAPGEEYLRITRDSTRVYVADPAKGVKGGFAIGGFSRVKGPVINFMNLTPENYLIGERSGSQMTTGLYNSFMGFNSGLNNTTGSNNSFFGYQSGYSNGTGNSNLFIGYQSGFSNQAGNFNSFMGYQSGFSNSSGANNTFLGSYTGKNNSSGSDNTFLGFFSGYVNTVGASNSFVGTNAGYNNLSGKSNVFIGPYAGYANAVGDSNIFIGMRSGTNNSTGRNNIFLGGYSGYRFTTGTNNINIGFLTGYQSYSTNYNIFLGYKAGRFGINPNPTIIVGDGNIWLGKNAGWNIHALWGDQFDGLVFPQRPLENTLVIDQNEGNYGYFSNYPVHYPAGDLNHYPLIFGNFSYEAGRRCVVINGVYSYTYTFFVNGQAGGKTAWANVSDARQKKNVMEIPGALDKIIKLRGVNFDWIDTLNMPAGRQMGFIAQEVEKVIPEVVTNKGGAYLMSYAPVTALLVEGIKEQQRQIIESRKENSELRSELQALKEQIAQIKSAMENK